MFKGWTKTELAVLFSLAPLIGFVGGFYGSMLL